MLSTSYNAARFRHIDRMTMQCTVAELRAMEVALSARLLSARTAAAVGFTAGADAASNAVARRIAVTEVYPTLRLLEIVQRALPVAAERSINNMARARRAAERRTTGVADTRRHGFYARGF